MFALLPLLSSGTPPQDNPYVYFDWVDLGLPSGLYWASANIVNYGSSRTYLACGETSAKDYYSWSTYTWPSEDNLINPPAYEGEGDYSSYLGMGSRVPTEEEWKELRQYCDWKYVNAGDYNGWLVFSRVNDNFIFLPLGGYKTEDTVHFAKTQGYYATSTIAKDDDRFARYVFLTNKKVDFFKIPRYCGLLVRPVCDSEILFDYLLNSGKLSGYMSIEDGTYLRGGIFETFYNFTFTNIRNENEYAERGQEIPEDFIEDVIPYPFAPLEPKFQGGDEKKFLNWLYQELLKSEKAKTAKCKFIILFKVDTDGSVIEASVLHGINQDINQEVVRIISSSPRWTPGGFKHRRAPVLYILPFRYRI